MRTDICQSRLARERTGAVARLVAECDVVLSILNPGAALDFAREAADALRASGRQTLIVDCNAIAPDTVHEIAGVVERSDANQSEGLERLHGAGAPQRAVAEGASRTK